MDEQTRDLALADFLRRHRDLIVERWLEAVVERPESRGLSRDALVDHLPQLLDAIATAGEAHVDDPRARIGTDTAALHALERLGEGMDLGHVVIELAVLRDCVLQAWDETRPAGVSWPEIRFLNRSVDRAIAASVERYVEARDRTLLALDRISTASLESRDLDDLLRRLLHVMAETTESIDTGVILLREGEELVVRAAAGVEEGVRVGTRVRMGDGFAGSIAAERRARALSTMAEGPPLHSPFLRATELRCLYGIPLVDGGELVGVATIGSSTAPDVSDQDRRLFEAMGARATSAIVQHVLHADAERRAAELAAVLTSMPDPVFIGSLARIREVNAGALTVLGFGSREELNHGLRTLHVTLRIRHADTGAPMAPDQWPFARALHGETSTTEVVIFSPRTGRDMVLRCAAAPITRDDGTIEDAVCVCIDVTDARERDRGQRLAKEQAEQAVRDRQHVLGVVSHDLRNPLNTVLLGAEAMKTLCGSGGAGATRAIESIIRAGRRMDRLIGDLLDVTSIQAGRLSVTLLPTAALPALEDAVTSVRAAALDKGLAVDVEGPAGEGLLVRADRDRLVQALTNLLSNAVKVTEKGSVTARVAADGDSVVFSVSDTGPGMPADVAAKMFEPYWRSKSVTYQGTGLGLSIVRGIVEAHGGRVLVDTAEGKGTTFRFALPLVRAATD